MSDSRPKFRDDVRAHVLAGDLVVLDTASGIELLEGRLSSALVHQLSTGKPLPEIIAQVGGALDTFDAAYELDELRRRGLIETVAAGEVPIVLAADYLDPQLATVNAEALQSGRPWMLARPRGPVVWIGPVFVPGRGPCWQCLATRLRAVRAAWQLPERRDDVEQPVMRIGLELASLEAERFQRMPDAPARLLTFDTRSLAQHEHRVVRLRHCAACGERAAREFAPVVLHNREKAFTFDGGHRAAPPEETFARYAHHISPLTGIVHHVERANGDSGLLNVFVARHNYITGKQATPSQSYGKGVTAALARTGALCEALERYSGQFHGDEPFLKASYRELSDAVHPNDCYRISESQYEHREEWNRDAPTILWTPNRFNENETIDWAPAWSLTHERKRYVPAAYCYYGYRAEFAIPDSNGNAAGTCIEDAILQGLLELIERDAAGIWWYGRIRRPAIAFDSPYVRTMTCEYASRGRELRLLDLTTDIGIPVCAAVAIGEKQENFYLGLGALAAWLAQLDRPAAWLTLDPAIAVTRAITEANQLLAAQRRGRLYRGEIADFSFLEPDGVRELTTTVQPSADISTDVRNCVNQIGLEVIVLDQTREEIGLPVVKVIVPGLRHFRPRFAPGRLYDVPVQLGWLDRPLREEELNPAHLNV